MKQTLTGYTVGTKDPIDSRFLMTKAEMKARVDALTPSPYPCWCKDDGKMYIYNVNNEVNEETGKYEVFKGGSSGGLEQVDAMQTAGATTVNKTVQYVGETDTDYVKGGIYFGIATTVTTEEATTTEYSWQQIAGFATATEAEIKALFN